MASTKGLLHLKPFVTPQELLMDPFSRISLWLVSLILLLSTFFYLNRKSKLVRLPPGPPRWPVVGSLFYLGSRPHRDMHRMYEKYGPIIFLKLGCVNVMSTNDPDVIREVLVTQDTVFASRPNSIAIEHFSYNCTDVAFSPYGPHWKAMRRICLEHLLTTRRLQSFRVERQEEARNIVYQIWKQAQQGKKIQFRHCFTAFNMNCLTRMLISKRYYVGEPSADLSKSNFAHIIHEISSLLGVMNIGDYLPALRRLDLQGYEKKIKEVRDRVDEFQTAILEQHREKMRQKIDGNIPNFVDVLLALREQGDQELTDSVIKALVQDMLAGGTDTSTTTAEWVMTEVLRNPEEMRKAQEELDRVVGRERMVEESDLSKLPYLRCIVKETMRLRPIGPFILPRYSIRETKVLGYDIPAKTMVLINLYSHGRNPKVWGNEMPLEEFHPERHKKDHTKIETSCGSDMRHVVFGAGKRRCPGAPLGVTLVMFMVSSLLHSFNWSVPEDHIIDTMEMPAMTSAPVTPLLAFATPRLSPNLYDFSP